MSKDVAAALREVLKIQQYHSSEVAEFDCLVVRVDDLETAAVKALHGFPERRRITEMERAIEEEECQSVHAPQS